MIFEQAEFYTSVSLGSEKIFFDTHKEIIFVWRSNVWKSSIMNALFQKKDLVKTSARPGKTKTANIFKVANKYYFTDLPGYGFAKLGKEFKEALDGLISWYTEERKDQIKQVIMLIDSKLWPQQSDRDMYEFLLELEMPVTIVLSKIDKLSKNEVHKSLAFAQDAFFGQKILPVSSQKKTGLRELELHLRDILA